MIAEGLVIYACLGLLITVVGRTWNEGALAFTFVILLWLPLLVWRALIAGEEEDFEDA